MQIRARPAVGPLVERSPRQPFHLRVAAPKPVFVSIGDSDLWTLYQIGVRQCRSGHGGTARQRCHQPTQLVLLLQTYVKLHKVT